MKNTLLILSLLFALYSCRKVENKQSICETNPDCFFKPDIHVPKGFTISEIDSLEFNGRGSVFQFVNDQVGYTLISLNIGGYAGVLKTVDGGHSWTNLNINIPQSATGMFFVDENTGLIPVIDVTGCPPPGCLNKCVAYKTEDGGQNWRKIEYPNLTGQLYQIQSDGLGNLFALLNLNGIESTLVKSTDNGENWDKLYDAATLGLVATTFNFKLFKDKIYILYPNGRLNKIDTNGQFLETVFTQQAGITDFKIIDQENLLFIGSNRVIKSKDGGNSWNATYDKSAIIIDFITPERGLMLLNNSYCPSDLYQANDIFIATDDGGLHWTKSEEATNLCINFVNSQKIADERYFIMIDNKLFELKRE